MIASEHQVYEWLKRNADGDGFVETSAPSIACRLDMPKRTVNGILSRLEREGYIYLYDYCRIAVTELCE